MDSRWIASFGVGGESWQSQPTEQAEAEKPPGLSLSHVTEPSICAGSSGRGIPSHEPSGLLGVGC